MWVYISVFIWFTISSHLFNIEHLCSRSHIKLTDTSHIKLPSVELLYSWNLSHFIIDEFCNCHFSVYFFWSCFVWKLIGIKKKLNCDFLSCNSDFFLWILNSNLTILSLHHNFFLRILSLKLTILLFSQNSEFKTHNFIFFSEFLV